MSKFTKLKSVNEKTFVVGYFQANVNTVKILSNRDTDVVTIAEAT